MFFGHTCIIRCVEPIIDGATVHVWEWISNFIPHFKIYVITYPYHGILSRYVLPEMNVSIGQWAIRWTNNKKGNYIYTKVYILMDHMIIYIYNMPYLSTIPWNVHMKSDIFHSKFPTMISW